MTNRILVWDFPTRVFHWGLAISFAIAYLTHESSWFQQLHLASGYSFFGLLLFRLLWGRWGNRYARFQSFLFSLKQVYGYVLSMVRRKPDHYLGHNPLGAIAVFVMLGLGLLVAVSGIGLDLEFGGNWGEVLFAFLHESLSEVMLLVVVVHIAGVLLSSRLHRENLVFSMFHGKKETTGDEADTASHHLFVGVILFFALVLFFGYYLLF